MNLVLLFEGTGQGVEGRFTNVTRLRDLLVEDGGQRLHLESGPGTHFGAYLFGKMFGADGREILRSARRWFQQNYKSLPPADFTKSAGGGDNWSRRTTDDGSTSVFLFGFSRGALLARYFAEWLDRIGVPVAYLGVWDTVDSTMKLDVSVEAPENVRRARHAIARDECRRYFGIVPLHAPHGSSAAVRARFEELVFPGVHSDVGGLYADNHRMADETLRWIAAPACEVGMRLKDGATLDPSEPETPIVLHASHRLISNLWGLLGTVKRELSGLKVFSLPKT